MHRPYKLREADDDIEVVEIEEDSIEDQLIEIGDNLGYPFTGSDGKGSFYISDNVEVSVRFSPKSVTSIEARIIKNPARFNCTRSTTTIDNISVELQTCVLVIKDIRSKIKVVG